MASRPLRLETKWSLVAVFSACLAGAAAPALGAAGDPAAGESQALVCAACHGQDGATGLDPTYPNLAGQNERYLLTQLTAIRDGSRDVPLMAGQLTTKSDQDLEDLAAYYASLPGKVGQAQGDDDTLAQAEGIYRGGIAAKGVAACTACHSPSGNGNTPAGYPHIGGQASGYVIAQLTAYREGTRTTDEDYGGMMRGVAQGLTDKEIAALADYIHGLH
jgi:cytochrome c553